MRTPTNDKALAERLHAKRRAFERFGAVLNRAALKGIARDIQEGRLKVYDRQSNRLIRYEYVLEGHPCVVVYDRQRHEVVTFLTREQAAEVRPAERA